MYVGLHHDMSACIMTCVGVFRRQQQDEMIERDVMLWLVQLLQNCDMISDYMLEYAVALLMNLCLRTAGLFLFHSGIALEMLSYIGGKSEISYSRLYLTFHLEGNCIWGAGWPSG